MSGDRISPATAFPYGGTAASLSMVAEAGAPPKDYSSSVGAAGGRALSSAVIDRGYSSDKNALIFVTTALADGPAKVLKTPCRKLFEKINGELSGNEIPSLIQTEDAER